MSENSHGDGATEIAPRNGTKPPRDCENATGLSPAQKRFLRALELDCDPTSASARVLAKLPPTRLAEWLERSAFRRRLQELLDMVARKRRMTLQIASGRAAERLDASFDADADDPAALSSEQRRTCLELVKLVEGRRGAAGGAGGAAEGGASAAGVADAPVRQTRTAESGQSGAAREISSPANLVHHEVPPQEAQELEEQLGD